MDMKICCESNVSLVNLFSIKEVKTEILDFELKNGELNGNVVVNGNYIDKDNNLNEIYEKIPVTVMFKDNNYYVENLKIENFKYYEIVNNGITVSFDLIVNYNISNQKDNIIDVNIGDNDNQNEKNELNLDNISNQNISDIVTDESDDNSLEEEIKEKYDKLLDEIFNSRNEENIDEKNSETNNTDAKNSETNNIETNNTEANNIEANNIETNNIEYKDDKNIHTDLSIDKSLDKSYDKSEINITTNNKKNNNLNFLKFLDVQSTYRIYYPNEESEIEKICKNENISITNIYNNDYNKDFNTKKRIIVDIK